MVALSYDKKNIVRRLNKYVKQIDSMIVDLDNIMKLELDGIDKPTDYFDLKAVKVDLLFCEMVLEKFVNKLQEG